MVSVSSRFKVFFFLNFMGVGILMPYLALYILDKGISGPQLGIILGSLPLVKTVAQPAWGLLADARRLHRQILGFSLLAVALSALFFPRTDGFWPVFATVLLFGVLDSPHLSFGTTLALDYLEGVGQLDGFGPLRLWGSVGYILSVFGVGSLLLERSLHLLPQFFAMVMGLAGLVALTLPGPGGARFQFVLKDSLALLTGSPAFAWILVGLALCGATQAVSSQYFPVYLRDLRAAGWMIGVSVGLQASLEIPLMAKAPQILRRIGAPAVLLIGMGVLPLRWLLHAGLHSPGLLLPVNLLHGWAITGVTVAGTLYVSRLLPARWRGTGQALYSAAYAGIGWSMGLFAAGWIYGSWGMTTLWLVCATIGAASVVIAGLALRGGQHLPAPASAKHPGG